MNETARKNGIATIGISHGTVHGCMTEHGVPMAGFDHEFTTASLFDANATAFMLGHIHKHQAWQRYDRLIAYAGSIGRLHYGEQGDKGFLLWEIGADAARFDLVPTPAKRTIDIVFGGMPDLNAIKKCAQETAIDGAFIRVRWTMPEEDRHEVDRKEIERILHAAAEVKLEGRVIPVIRTRAAGISKEASIAAKVQVWAKATATKDEPLLACLAALQQKTPEEIAADILTRPIAAESAMHAVSEAACAAIVEQAKAAEEPAELF